MTTCFQIETEESGGSLRVRLFGEFDLGGYERVDDLLSVAQAEGKHEVTIDLRGLTFIDSSGLRAIVRGQARALAVGGAFRLIQGPPNVRRTFEIAGLDTRLEFIEEDG